MIYHAKFAQNVIMFGMHSDAHFSVDVHPRDAQLFGGKMISEVKRYS